MDRIKIPIPAFELDWLEALEALCQIFEVIGHRLDNSDFSCLPNGLVRNLTMSKEHSLSKSRAYKMTIQWRNNRKTKNVRKLHLENLEIRQTMNADFDDQISEASPVQIRSEFPVSVSGIVDASVDVDMFAFNASYGQTIDFDIDTRQNGPGGLGAYIRIFNSQGVQISANNDAAAPGESRIGFDSYLRHTFNSSGIYYVGVCKRTPPPCRF